MKTVIPRNKLVPDPSFADIIASAPEMTDSEGNSPADILTLYQGNDINLRNSVKLVEGFLHLYRSGAIYLPKYPTHIDRDLAFLKEAFKESLNPLVSFGLESVMGKVPMQIEKASETLMDDIFSEKEFSFHHIAAEKAAGELTKRGAVYLPYVQLVEIEYQMFPRFLRKPACHFLLTYEQLNGERTTYGTDVTPDYRANPDWFVQIMLGRRLIEFDYLISLIKNEQLDPKPLTASVIQKYQSEYGEKWIEHHEKIKDEVQDLQDKELVRIGFTEQHVNAELLKRIAPLLPTYRQIPFFDSKIKYFESKAAGN